MNEFDKELDEILAEVLNGNMSELTYLERIKQAIEKHIIGEPVDVTPEGLEVNDVNSLTTEETVRLSMAKGMNLEKAKARQKLRS